MPSLGVVIVNYREYDRTEWFIREEISRIRRPYRLVVVDNGGEPERAETLRERTGSEVIVIISTRKPVSCAASIKSWMASLLLGGSTSSGFVRMPRS